jgi:transcriptional regulator GlxA family with amidase domain
MPDHRSKTPGELTCGDKSFSMGASMHGTRMLDKSRTIPRFVFLLQPEFPINAFVLATEALRIVNQNSGRTLVSVVTVSEDGRDVRASNGMWIEPDDSLAKMPSAEVVLVFEGNLPVQRNTSRLLSSLRAAHRHGALIAGIDTGAFALTQAGLLDDTGAAVHWEAAPSYRERFPGRATTDRLFVEGQGIASCAGGVATLDFLLTLIERFHGRALALEVADALVHTPRPGTAPQRRADQLRDTTPALSRRLIALMERNLDFPLAPAVLASELGISVRKLERHCRRIYGQSPMQLYLKVRLQAARNLLFYEEQTMKDIADACGFSYPSVFTRAFKAQFGDTPRAFRLALRRRQDQTVRPEIVRLSRREHA